MREEVRHSSDREITVNRYYYCYWYYPCWAIVVDTTTGAEVGMATGAVYDGKINESSAGAVYTGNTDTTIDEAISSDEAANKIEGSATEGSTTAGKSAVSKSNATVERAARHRNAN